MKCPAKIESPSEGMNMKRSDMMVPIGNNIFITNESVITKNNIENVMIGFLFLHMIIPMGRRMATINPSIDPTFEKLVASICLG